MRTLSTTELRIIGLSKQTRIRFSIGLGQRVLQTYLGGSIPLPLGFHSPVGLPLTSTTPEYTQIRL